MLKIKKLYIFVSTNNNMKNLGNFLGHFTVKNDNEEKLFKVYFYDNGISFDENLLKGIIDNEDVYKDFIKINNSWKNDEKDKEITMKSILEMLERHQDYLSNFFLESQIKKEEIFSSELFLQILKEKFLLNKITRKEFESKITDEKYGEYYVENLIYTKDNSEFYKYKSEISGIDFYLMVVDDKIKIGFPDINNQNI